MLLCSTEVVLRGNGSGRRKEAGGVVELQLENLAGELSRKTRAEQHSDQIKQI